MKANNLLVLKALLDEVLSYFEAEGNGFMVIRRPDGRTSERQRVLRANKTPRRVRPRSYLFIVKIKRDTAARTLGVAPNDHARKRRVSHS